MIATVIVDQFTHRHVFSRHEAKRKLQTDV